MLTIPGYIQFYFQLINDYEKHVQMLRGLMSLGQTKNAETLFHAADRSFHIVVGLGNEESMATHLEKVLPLFTEEISFRNRLKRILQIEKKLKDEISLLYMQ